MSSHSAFATATEVRADACHVIVRGELDLAAEPAVLAEALRALEESTPNRLVLDVAEVSFIDSSGLRVLLRCRDSAQRAGRRFALRVANNQVVTRLLSLAGVESWFEIE